jgi:hypothetical protein
MPGIGDLRDRSDNPVIGCMSDKLDIGDKMSITYYLDKDDFRVEFGTIVGYEEFMLNSDNEDKLYIVVELPNYGNTVIMRECVVDDKCRVIGIVGETLIEVEPWRIGAI